MKIKGNDIIVFCQQENLWKALAYGLSCEVDVTAETITVSNPRSGRFPKKKKKRISWGGSSAHLLSDEVLPIDIKDLVQSEIPIRILIGSVEVHKDAVDYESYIPDGRFWLEGEALVTRATVTASKGTLSTISMEFEGSGELDWHDYCEVIMTGDELLHDNEEKEYNVYKK